MAQDYARALARVIVAQTAESVGFDAVQQSAGETLSELLIQYISEIGGATHSNAELAGRVECNVNDLLLALEDVGASAEEIMDYTEQMEDLTFAHTVPAFPVAKKAAAFVSFQKKGEDPPVHIPSFLPAFPETHTYVDTPVFTGHTKDARQQKLAQGKAKKDAEKALLNLAARAESKAHGRDSKGEGKQTDNPFLASPERQRADAPDLAEPQPMDVDSIPRHVPSVISGGWQEGAEAQPTARHALFSAPLKLDWTQPSHLRLRSDPSDLGFEDAFSNAAEEVVDTGGRKRRLSLKAKSAGDPASQRAEQLLSAGASAMNLEEAAPEKSGR